MKFHPKDQAQLMKSMNDILKPRPISESPRERLAEAERRLAERQRVKVNWRKLTITVHGSYEYEADLEDFSTTAKILDWILQIHSKAWCDADLINEFLEVLEESCWIKFNNSMQGVFCPCGKTGSVANWKTGEIKRVK